MSNAAAIDSTGYSIFVSEVQELLACITGCVKLPAEEIDLQDLQRFTHTLKGVLAVYALDAAVAAAHAMEDNVHQLQINRKGLTKLDRLRLQRTTQQLGREVIQGLRKLSANLNKKQGKKAKPAKKKNTEAPLLLTVPVTNGVTESLAIPTLNDVVQAPKLQTMAPILKRYLDTADHLAQKMGKKIDVHISGAEVPLPQPGMTFLFASALHLIRNAVDHGIETSAKRMARGKSERGTLKLIARQYRGMFLLCIADDGAGINVRRVRDLAVRKGLLPKSKASRASQDELVDLIFTPGFSLKKKVTTVSGRGVGMDAVKFAVERMQGSMEIKTAVGKGTVMKIAIPYL